MTVSKLLMGISSRPGSRALWRGVPVAPIVSRFALLGKARFVAIPMDCGNIALATLHFAAPLR
jgi:hypothetical protein